MYICLTCLLRVLDCQEFYDYTCIRMYMIVLFMAHSKNKTIPPQILLKKFLK